MRMGFNFLSQDRFKLLTFFLVSLTLSVCSSQPAKNNVTTTLYDNTEHTTDSNKTEPQINKTLIHSTNYTSFNPGSAHNEGPQIGSTDLILVIGCVFSIAFLSVVVFAIYRFQVRKKAEYHRAAKAQVSSTRNAGVYMDLAMDNPISNLSLPINVPIYNSMKKRQDQYTFVSDDELDL